MVSRKEARQSQPLDNSLGLRAFETALFFWVPVVNLFIVPIAVLFAIASLVRSTRDPKRYGGRRYAIAAIVLCCVGIGILLYAISQLGIADVLATNIGQASVSSNLLASIFGGMVLELLILIGLRNFGVIKYYDNEERKDTSSATAAFILALVSWVPLFNLFSNPLSLYFSVKAVYNYWKDPQKYGGFKRTTAALVISLVWVGLFVYSWIVFGPKVLFKR